MGQQRWLVNQNSHCTLQASNGRVGRQKSEDKKRRLGKSGWQASWPAKRYTPVCARCTACLRSHTTSSTPGSPVVGVRNALLPVKLDLDIRVAAARLQHALDAVACALHNIKKLHFQRRCSTGHSNA